MRTGLAELKEVEPELIHVIQLCDGNATAPVGREAMLWEARFSRRLLGEGEFDLEGIWHVMPQHVDVSVEVPLGEAGKHLSFAERAKVLKASADTFLARYGAPGRSRVH